MNELIKKADQFMIAAEQHRKGLLSDEWLQKIEDEAFKELERITDEEYVDTIRELKYGIIDLKPQERANDLWNHIIPELRKEEMTEEQKEDAILNKKMDSLTPYQRRQVYVFAFGEEFMDSDDKGDLKTYRE